jgi:hypothetical protein
MTGWVPPQSPIPSSLLSMTDHPRPRNDEPTASPESRYSIGLRVIAIYKAVETVGMLLAAAVAFHLERQDNVERLVHWLGHLSLTDSSGLRGERVSPTGC